MQGDERYRFIGNKIAEGGQGAVYLAEDIMYDNRQVAVKVLNSEACAEMAFLRQLLIDEFKLQAKLSNQERPHPNIVYVMDVRTIDGEPAIVMEYVEGKSIYDLMGPRSDRRPLQPMQFFDITLQICEGLAFAHTKGVIHRDIKPRNILFRERDGVVKIIDWGVAKNIDIAGRGRTFAGTPPYMSPEVLLLNRGNVEERMSGSGVDHRTDIYSLGVTMFEMLTTSLPFLNPMTREEDVLKGAGEEHRRRMLDMGLDSDLANVVLKTMARDPDKRYQRASDLKDAIQEFRDSGRTILVRSAPVFKPVEIRSESTVAQQIQEAWKPARAEPSDHAEAERRFVALLSQYPDNSEVRRNVSEYYTWRSQSSSSQSNRSQSSNGASQPVVTPPKKGVGIAIGAGAVVLLAVPTFLFLSHGSSPNAAPTPAASNVTPPSQPVAAKPEVHSTAVAKVLPTPLVTHKPKPVVPHSKPKVVERQEEKPKHSAPPVVHHIAEHTVSAPPAKPHTPPPEKPKPSAAPVVAHKAPASNNDDAGKKADELLNGQ